MVFDKVYKNLINVLFPELCCVCKMPLKHLEDLICLDCRLDLALIKANVVHYSIVGDYFYGRVDFKYAFTMFSFHKKGKNQQLIHSLKYRNKPNLGIILGNWFINNANIFEALKTIDLVVGVPIHKKRLRARGYNQIGSFGKTIANNLNVPFTDSLLKKEFNSSSQTSKSRFDRWHDVKNLFSLNNTLPDGCYHLLLVDDVITTGATIEACANTILKKYNVSLSIACIAVVT